MFSYIRLPTCSGIPVYNNSQQNFDLNKIHQYTIHTLPIETFFLFLQRRFALSTGTKSGCASRYFGASGYLLER